ncbi:MAG: hypothetical protein ACJAZR_001972, partial [Sediminicola sp.]
GYPIRFILIKNSENLMEKGFGCRAIVCQTTKAPFEWQS